MAEPTRVGNLLGAVPRLGERLAEARLLAAWPSLAGPGGARSRAEAVEDGCLLVAVDGSGWLHRLTLETPALLERCRAVAPVRAIRYRLAANPAAAPAPAAPPSPETRAAIEAVLDPVRTHPTLTAALRRVMTAAAGTPPRAGSPAAPAPPSTPAAGPQPGGAP